MTQKFHNHVLLTPLVLSVSQKNKVWLVLLKKPKIFYNNVTELINSIFLNTNSLFEIKNFYQNYYKNNYKNIKILYNSYVYYNNSYNNSDKNS